MAQGRMLKKEISNSDKLGAVKTDRARVLYFMMLPHLDVAGRLEANTKRIKGQITTMLPYSEKVIQACLEQLHNVGLIVLYQNSGKQYIEYTRFGDFQNLNPQREAESQIPPPTPEDSRGLQITPPKVKLSKVKLNKTYTSEFEIFWKKFKGRWNADKGRYIKVGKWQAFEEWGNLTPDEQKKAMTVADRTGDKYTPDACRWLKNRRFDDYKA